jgi:hypothetical protein
VKPAISEAGAIGLLDSRLPALRAIAEAGCVSSPEPERRLRGGGPARTAGVVGAVTAGAALFGTARVVGEVILSSVVG